MTQNMQSANLAAPVQISTTIPIGRASFERACRAVVHEEHQRPVELEKELDIWCGKEHVDSPFLKLCRDASLIRVVRWPQSPRLAHRQAGWGRRPPGPIILVSNPAPPRQAGW